MRRVGLTGMRRDFPGLSVGRSGGLSVGLSVGRPGQTREG